MILSINEHIAAVLNADERITDEVGTRCFPIASVDEVAFPLIVYSRVSVNPMYNKVQRTLTETQVAVYVAADNYAQGLRLAELVVEDLDKKAASYDDFEVMDARIVSASEDYNNGTYVQEIDFTFTIK